VVGGGGEGAFVEFLGAVVVFASLQKERVVAKYRRV
jgi:hypothetical protein